MSRTILIECSPRRPSDGVVVPVRLVFKSVARANFLGVQWHPAVVSVPAFESSLGFDGRSFATAPSPQIGELVFALTAATRFAGALVWANAAVTMKHALWTAAGGDPADSDFTTIWTGLAEDIATGNGQARVRLLDAGQALRVPVAAAKFGSTGDALLDSADALKDRTAETRVPRAWGRCLSIPALIVDRANNIWLFTGNAATSVQAFYDGGAAFTLGTGRASLAALQANVPAAGAVDYCLDASGKFLARPWTTPVYPFTAAATFGSAKAADIASTIVAGRTAVTFAAGTVSAFNILQTADCGLYLEDDTSVAAALDRLFSGLGGWWRLGSAGTVALGLWAWASPALTAAVHRRHAPERLRIIAPTRRRALGYARNDRVHSEGEIARILLAGDLAYGDGTSIEALKPSAAGATRNTDPNNLIREAADLADLYTSNASLIYRLADTASAPSGAPQRVYFTATGEAFFTPAAASQFLPLVPGSTYYWAYTVGRQAAANGSIDFRVNVYGADDTYIATLALGSTVVATLANGAYTRLSGAWAIPVTVPMWNNASDLRSPVKCAPHSAWFAATVGQLLISNPYLGRFQPGADVTAAAQVVVLTPASVNYAADYTGTLIGSLTNESIRVSRGGASIKLADGTGYAITVTGGITATVDNTNGSGTKGDITLTSFTGASGQIAVVVTVDGVAQPRQVILFTKTSAPPPVTGGAGSKFAYVASYAALSVTTDTVLATMGSVTIATGESLYGTAALDYEIDGTTSASRTASLKWQYDAGGGTWTDFISGTYVTGSAAASGRFQSGEWIDPVAGFVAASQTKSGLAAGAYPVRLVGKLSTTGRTATFYGTATIEAKV